MFLIFRGEIFYFCNYMQFLYPAFLYGLLALAIPVIIHLFYFRRFKRVYFTNVKFLKEVKEETSARRKIRNLLVLLARLLAMALLILGFAQPFLPQDSVVKKGQKAVSVFIDNSFSMSSLSQDVPLIDKAKERAREIVAAYNVDDRFQVLTGDFESRHQRLVSKEDALVLIDEIKVSPSVKKLSQVLVRQKQALETRQEDEVMTSYLVSDFQKNITDLENFTDTTVAISLLPLQSVQEKNIAIDSCWFDSPVQMKNQTNPLIVKIKNYSQEDADNVRLALKLDGQIKPVGTMNIPAGREVTDTVNLTILRNGWHKAELTITDYPVQFDDSYYFAFNVAEQVNALVINGAAANKYLNAAFKGIETFDIINKTTQNLDYSSFPTFDLIVTNDLNALSSGLSFELTEYIKNGGNVLIFPAASANKNSYNTFFDGVPANQLGIYESIERRVSNLNTEEFVFKDVFENKGALFKLPVTQANFALSKFSSRGEEPLMIYRDGSSYLAKYRAGQGHLYLCASPLDQGINDLVKNGEVFVPMLYKMAISSAKYSKIAYVIGKDEVLDQPNQSTGAEMIYKIKGKDEEFIPEQKVVGSKVILGMNNQIKKAGFYDLYLNKENPLNVYGYNFDRRESELQYTNLEGLANMTQNNPAFSIVDSSNNANFAELIKERSTGIVLWRWCIILALIFLAIEVLLLRFWKVD